MDSQVDYQIELEFAKALALRAGEKMRAAFGLHTASTWKSDNSPLTEADVAINKFVIEQVSDTFPDDGILGEEMSFEPKRQRVWVVDPIDGTFAFTLGAPLSTFCLALVVDGQPLLGIVFDPYLNRMFWARRGQGAYVNDERLQVSTAETVQQNYVLLSSRAMEPGKKTGVLYDAIEDLGGKAFSFRSFAYSCCLVAAGTAVASVIGRPKPWDVAAAQIILEEAGGKATDQAGNVQPYDSQTPLIATNGLVHDALLEVVNGG